jgi:phytoene desaturase
MEQKNIIVVGAGIGGLTAAAILASRGHKVTAFEKNTRPGGKMQEVKASGYRFDTGPSLLTMPFLLENVFRECGESLDDYLELSEVDPICRYFYKDETIFDNFADRQKTVEEIERFAPQDVKGYRSFLNRSEDIYNKTADAFLFNPLYELQDLKSLKFRDMLDIDALSTVSKKVDEYVVSPHLRKFFKRFTTYNGSSPYQAPATLNVIPHVELNQGGFYVHGGLYSIAQALFSLCVKVGVEFHFSTEIESFQTENDRITGCTTSGNNMFTCDVLFSNADASETILSLLPEGAISKRKKKRQRKIEPSCSGFVILLGCSQKWDQLRHHNIFFSEDYRKEFKDIFERKVLPSDPTIYVANTSYSDSDHAPDGSSNLFILVNAPYLAENQDWNRWTGIYRDKIIDELEHRGLTGLRDSVEYISIITPEDFYEKYRSNKGSIYGTSSNNTFSAFIRPRNKVRSLSNLYMVGGSTHPGGGIPLVIQSAFNAVELLDRSE